ncbi:transcriptional repressor [Priestia koreensis]|uniref:transcriptional repressor n=1 Tax=Priestia koreensis TaxID=284581 RepID=UPI00345940CD
MLKTKYLTYLKEKGCNCTPQRTMILSYLNDYGDTFISLRTMMENIKKQNPHITYRTVQRNIYLFVEIGLLTTMIINGQEGFRLNL